MECAERLTRGLWVSQTANEYLQAQLILFTRHRRGKLDSEKVLEEKREDMANSYGTLGRTKVQEITPGSNSGDVIGT